MINPSNDKDFRAKKESDSDGKKLSKSSTSSSRQWAGFKNPRIVRVSRSFGGKDRHSKVCTVRGLRDRRIRLSVQTAIQLYDLQDRLGFAQPSRVVDWLLDATKDDIDKLPPLQMPQGDFSLFHQQTLAPFGQLNAPQSSLSPFFNLNSEFLKDGGSQLFSKEGIRINDRDADDQTLMAEKSKYWSTNSEDDSRAKCKEIEREDILGNKWNITTNEQENQGYIPQLSAQNFFPLPNQFSYPGLLNNTTQYNWEPPNLSLSQLGTQFAFPTTTTPSFSPQFAPYMASHNMVESDPRQINHFQLSSSGTSQHIVPNSLVPPYHFISPFNVNPKVNPQNNNDDRQPNKESSGCS